MSSKLKKVEEVEISADTEQSGGSGVWAGDAELPESD